MTETPDPAHEQQHLRSMLESATLEIIPTKNVLSKVTTLEPGSRLSVTASPKAGTQATLDLTAELCKREFQVVPHLSARLIQSQSHLQQVLGTLENLGIEEVFVVGGDGEPLGPYRDARGLLEEIRLLGTNFPRVGIGCYPEGHPSIGDAELSAALSDKQSLASVMTSQMCFSSESLVKWALHMRRSGINLPLRVGLPGVIDPVKLARISVRIGVGQSLRFVAKNRRLATNFLRPRGYDPTDLAAETATAATDERIGIEGFHIFTFNQIEETQRWRQQIVAGQT